MQIKLDGRELVVTADGTYRVPLAGKLRPRDAVKWQKAFLDAGQTGEFATWVEYLDEYAPGLADELECSADALDILKAWATQGESLGEPLGK